MKFQLLEGFAAVLPANVYLNEFICKSISKYNLNTYQNDLGARVPLDTKG